jgi:hypothetical protein
MVTTKTLVSYELKEIQQYYQLIMGNMANSERTLGIEQFLKMGIKQRRDFLVYLADEVYTESRSQRMLSHSTLKICLGAMC